MKLWKHQEDAIRESEFIDYYGLFHEVGVGKSRTAIEIIRGKYKRAKNIKRTLIVSPPITLLNWKNEWLKFSNVKEENLIVLSGSGVKRKEDIEKFGWDSEGKLQQKIFITNYETLLMEGAFNALLKWKPQVMLCDESQRLKSLTSKRTKKCLKLGELAENRYLLSGSPVLNSMLDLFPQILFLDRGQSLGSNFFGFRGRYFRDKNAGMKRDKYFPDFVLIPGSEEEIKRKTSHFISTCKKEEAIELPPLIQQDYYVDMPASLAKTYGEMKKDFITFLDGKECVATMALTKLMRLQQLASGFCRDAFKEDHEVKENPKLVALKSLLEEICYSGNKVIVWAAWKTNYTQIRKVCEELKIDCVEVSGEVSPKEKDKAIEEFCKGKASVLIGNAKSCGLGINLVEASYSIWYSRNFSLEDHIQSEGRNWRGGSMIHKKITHINLITKGTVDEDVAKALKEKQNLADRIIKNRSL